ncbi:6484_t:CDS:2 [Entrophospora sp. SA101]|nr:6484_t:CDS:2 [Entrophospora sp. SA101]
MKISAEIPYIFQNSVQILCFEIFWIWKMYGKCKENILPYSSVMISVVK